MKLIKLIKIKKYLFLCLYFFKSRNNIKETKKKQTI